MQYGSRWNERSDPTGASSGSPFWPHGARSEAAAMTTSWWKLGPVAFAGMVLGFVFFWPIGLAILFFNIWQRKGQPMPIFQMMERAFEKAPFQRTNTGNMAFDEWRNAELARIEEQRRKLVDAEREFAAFSDELRRAKDREEFDRFMHMRRAAKAETTA